MSRIILSISLVFMLFYASNAQRTSLLVGKPKYVRIVLAEKCVENSLHDTPLLVIRE